MAHDFCISCGALLPPRGEQCPVCGFNPLFDEEGDLMVDDQFIIALDDAFFMETDTPE